MAIIVNDREVIVEGIEALELGPLHTMTLEDALGKAPVASEGR